MGDGGVLKSKEDGQFWVCGLYGADVETVADKGGAGLWGVEAVIDGPVDDMQFAPEGRGEGCGPFFVDEDSLCEVGLGQLVGDNINDLLGEGCNGSHPGVDVES